MLPHAIRTVASLLRKRLTYVHAGVTHRCNLRCSMCRIWTRAGDLPEATPARWREVARVLAARGATTVSLGGGEPFCRADLPEIVAAFVDNGFRVRALTNGVMVNEKAIRDCLGAGLADISFSLDTLDPQVQERLDGMDDGFNKRLANLAMLTQTLPKHVPVLLNTVINALNLDQLPRISELAFRLGMNISFIPVHLDLDGDDDFFGCDAELQPDAKLPLLVHTAIDRLLIEKNAKGHIVNSKAFLRAIPPFILEGKSDWFCRAGSLYLSLRPDAKASICHHYEITDAIDIDQIESEWTPERLRQAVAACPHCLRPCWTEVALLADSFAAQRDQLRLQWQMRNAGRKPSSEEQIRKLIEELS